MPSRGRCIIPGVACQGVTNQSCHRNKSSFALIAIVVGMSLMFPIGERGIAQARSNENVDTDRNDKNRFIYLFEEYAQFMKIDFKENAVAGYWSLADIRQSEKIFPNCAADSNPPCAVVFPETMRYDPRRHRLYGAFPLSEWGTTKRTRFRILALQLPDFAVVGEIPIPQPQDTPPVVLLTPDGNQVLVGYSDHAAEANAPKPMVAVVLDSYNADGFTKMWSRKEAAPRESLQLLKSVLNSSFTSKAYFSSNGGFIFDGLERISVVGQTFAKSYAKPLDGLSTADRKRLSPFADNPAAEKPFFNYGVGESAAGRTIVRLTNRAATETAFWTVDLASRQTSPLIVGPFSALHLTSNGTFVVAEAMKYSGEAGKAPSGELRKTGLFQVYDVKSGELLREFHLPAVAGAATQNTLLGITPGGDEFFYSAKGHLYSVSLETGRVLMDVNTLFLHGPLSSGIFTAQ